MFTFSSHEHISAIVLGIEMLENNFFLKFLLEFLFIFLKNEIIEINFILYHALENVSF